MTARAEPERLLTIEQAAELANYDVATIRKWMDRGLPFVAAAEGKKRPRAKDVRIRSSDLWHWINSLVITRTPAAAKPARGKAAPKPPVGGGLSAWRAAKGAK